MSDSVRPHGQQPTRLLCPQDSAGKNTGVGCHFLLQNIHIIRLSRFSHTQLFAAPWTAAHQDPLSFSSSRICSDSCPVSQWCYLTVSSSAVPFFCLLLSPSIFPIIRVFSNELALCIQWPNIGASALASVLPVNIQSWLSLYLSIIFKIYLFLALLGLCCCTGFSPAAVLGLLIAVASLVAECGLSRASGFQ